jgi:hypothetical protein
MDILQAILGASGGGAVKQVASQFGLDDSQAASAIGSLLPALMGGIQNNVQQEGGMEALLGALSRGNHSRYLDDPSALMSQDTVRDGNGILGHLLGSKDVSRQVASHAAAQTGIGADIMKQLLPVVATMAMGALAKGGAQQGFLGQAAAAGAAPQASSGILDMISPFLDSNRDGSIADDVLGMVGKMFRR